MQLLLSETSPFARKCRIIIYEKCLEVTETKTMPFDDEKILHDANPLGKVPVLVLDNGVFVYDSPVICEYLDGLETPVKPKWLGSNILQQRILHAFGDGMIDAVLGFRMERIRPAELWWDFAAMRHENAIGRAILYLEEKTNELGKSWDFGNLAIVCALGYMDFRAPNVNWREHAPKLARWFENFEAKDSYTNTAPPQ